MKKKNLLIGVASLALLLTGCNPSSGGNDPEPYVPPVVVDDYKVLVTAPSSVHYTVNKDRAQTGEEIILTINSVDNGFSLKDVVLNSNRTLNPEADGKTYKFLMPNQSASIVIRVSVHGDVVIDGDFAATFTKGEGNVWTAKNVAVEAGSREKAGFDILVGTTKLKALDLDESRSWGDVSITFNSDTNFEIARGSSYDFTFYEDTSEFTVQRARVNDLPQSASELASILIDGYAVRSEPAMYIDGLVGVDYEIMDKSTNDVFNHRFVWKKYLNNTTYATIEDKLDDNNMLVYRHYDETNKTYEVVDTYHLKEGEKTINDDRFRESYNNYGAYSAKYDVIDEEDDYGYRYAKNVRSVMRELNSTSHNPAYIVERDFYQAYRSAASADEISTSEIKIVSTETADGFTTTLDSYFEYDSTAGTYTTDHHEGVVYDIDLSFDVRGALKTIMMKKTVYSKDQWDFTAHRPLTGQTGSVKVKINASYTYGNPTETCNFDPSPYFISSIDSYRYVSKSIAEKATIASDSYIALGDALMITDGTGNIEDHISISYSPATALDLWEYGPVSSTNEEAIAHLATDVYYQMTARNEGDAVVTFSNHVNGETIKGATIDVNCHVIAGKDIRSFYIQDMYDSSYADVDAWNQATIHANGRYKFKINSSPSGSPLIYTAVSSNTSYLTVVSAPNASDLVVDTTGAKDITENVLVKITLNSTRYENGAEPTVLNIYIMPAQANPVGTWKSLNYEDTRLYFTEEAYEAVPGCYKGSIVDPYTDNKGVYHGTDTFYFYYKYDGSRIDATIYAMTIETGTTPALSDMYLDFYYDPTTGQYGVFLAETEQDDEYNTYYTPFLGFVDETYTIIESYDPFVKIA